LWAVEGIGETPRLSCTSSDYVRRIVPHQGINLGEARQFPPRKLSETNSRSKRIATVRIELNCAACGNNHFSLDQEMDDHAHVRCRDCGHYIGTLAQLKERVAEEVIKRSAISANENVSYG
jgi:DNA-directed RNA polymerase subunit RPC12/RpoP